MFCNQCGNNVKEGTKFCNECGNLMQEATEPILKFCNECGNRTKEGQSFCTKCGKSLNNRVDRPAPKIEAPIRKKKSLMPFLIIPALVIFFIAAVFIGFKLKSDSKPIIAEIPSKELEDDIVEDIIEDSMEDIEEEEVDLIEDKVLVDEPEDIKESLYLFPSDTTYIIEEDLDSFTKEEVALIRNEIFARHGYIFTKEPYISYFGFMPWYVPNVNFTDSGFSEIEKENVITITSYERKMGW